jgi:hypothetical protein
MANWFLTKSPIHTVEKSRLFNKCTDKNGYTCAKELNQTLSYHFT